MTYKLYAVDPKQKKGKNNGEFNEISMRIFNYLKLV